MILWVSYVWGCAMFFFKKGNEVTPVLKWLGIMGFFAVVPPIFLKFGELVLRELSSSGQFQQFSDDLPWILLAFWSGTMGAIVSYAYERTHKEIDSQPSIVPITRFLFGGIVGAASYFLLRSAFLIKLLYPNVDVSKFDQEHLVDYRSVVAFAVICGLVGPSLVRSIRRRSQKL